jgi:hypothetical protein
MYADDWPSLYVMGNGRDALEEVLLNIYIYTRVWRKVQGLGIQGRIPR